MDDFFFCRFFPQFLPTLLILMVFLSGHNLKRGMETLTRSPPPFLCWEKAFLKIFFEENTTNVFLHLDNTTGPTKYSYRTLETTRIKLSYGGNRFILLKLLNYMYRNNTLSTGCPYPPNKGRAEKKLLQKVDN